MAQAAPSMIKVGGDTPKDCMRQIHSNLRNVTHLCRNSRHTCRPVQRLLYACLTAHMAMKQSNTQRKNHRITIRGASAGIAYPWLFNAKS